ncbi:MAG: hypothetical protein CVU40_09570 [Chloroflexi bacterium HGW-Chloroflexi-2]|jgi:hypothetical protein|nr:MAG: hypothetical protein CVU40_09570 [Chloroflexi bacterium HGW-Chloroflexi-2]
MSELRYYEDGQPIDFVENSEEEYNQQENPVIVNDLGFQEELSTPVIPSDYTDDQLEQLEDTIVNKTQENESTSMNEEVIRDIPKLPSIEPAPSFFDREESENFNQQWMEIQGKFVDEPRVAVQKADELISDMIKQITTMFDKELDTLETQWNQGDEVSTEDLRLTLQHYRSFFHRLVD